MKTLIFGFFFSFIKFTFINCIELNCEFKANNWVIPFKTFYCEVNNQGDIILYRWNRTINNISGNYKYPNTNENVKSVNIYNKNIFYFPLGVGGFFKNLEFLKIRESGLKEIRKEDLKELTKLRELNLDDNDIEVIEPDLFQYSPKLTLISLAYNKISHIDPHVFDQFFGKLDKFYLSGNVCRFRDAESSKQKGDEIIVKVQRENCKNEVKLKELTQGTATTRSSLTTVIHEIKKNFDKLIENTDKYKIVAEIREELERSRLKF